MGRVYLIKQSNDVDGSAQIKIAGAHTWKTDSSCDEI